MTLGSPHPQVRLSLETFVPGLYVEVPANVARGWGEGGQGRQRTCNCLTGIQTGVPRALASKVCVRGVAWQGMVRVILLFQSGSSATLTATTMYGPPGSATRSLVPAVDPTGAQTSTCVGTGTGPGRSPGILVVCNLLLVADVEVDVELLVSVPVPVLDPCARARSSLVLVVKLCELDGTVDYGY